jgi:hypothetical protein
MEKYLVDIAVGMVVLLLCAVIWEQKKIKALVKWAIVSGLLLGAGLFMAGRHGWLMFGQPDVIDVHRHSVSFNFNKLIAALLVIAVFTVLGFVAQKQKSITGESWYKRGLFGSLSFVLGVVIWIFAGFNLWSLALIVLGVVLRHCFTIPIRSKGVVIFFGNWQLDGQFWTMNGQFYLKPGLHFLLIPFDFPTFDIILIPHQVIFFGTQDKPEFTPEFNTKPSDGQPIGGIVRFEYQGSFKTGGNLRRYRDLSDVIRADPSGGIKSKIIKALKSFAMSHTLEDHLSKRTSEEYKNGMSEAIKKAEKESGEEFAVEDIRFYVLDPEPSAKVREQIENAASGNEKIVARRKDGEAAGAETAARIAAVNAEMQKPGGTDAVKALILLDRAANNRTVNVEAGGGIAKIVNDLTGGTRSD